MMNIALKHCGIGIVLATSAVFFTGCATTTGECDPSSVDFFKNTSCLASGAYAQRQRDMQSTLAGEQDRNTAFKAVLAELQAEQARVKGQLRGSQARYGRLDAAWGDLKRSLDRQTRENQTLAARVSQIDGEMTGRKGGDSATQQATRDQLKRQVGQLQKELDAGVY